MCKFVRECTFEGVEFQRDEFLSSERTACFVSISSDAAGSGPVVVGSAAG